LSNSWERLCVGCAADSVLCEPNFDVTTEQYRCSVVTKYLNTIVTIEHYKCYGVSI